MLRMTASVMMIILMRVRVTAGSSKLERLPLVQGGILSALSAVCQRSLDSDETCGAVSLFIKTVRENPSSKFRVSSSKLKADALNFELRACNLELYRLHLKPR